MDTLDPKDKSTLKKAIELMKDRLKKLKEDNAKLNKVLLEVQEMEEKNEKL